MKKKISVSMDEETIREIEKRTGKGLFRNNSHLIEFAVIQLLKNKLIGEEI